MTGESLHKLRRLLQTIAGVGVLAASFLAPSCAPKPPATTHVPVEVTTPAGEVRPVRVLIAEGISSAKLAISAPFTVEPWGPRLRGTPAVLAQCRPLASGLVQATPAALIVGDRHFPDDALFLRIQGSPALSVNGRQYRGNLVVRRTGPAELALVNVVDVEDYLYGVLGGETYPTWPPAALEAQAIVARSYTLWRMAQRRDEPFDLHATVMDQNYLGTSKEDPRLRAAVDRTAGMVLLYQMRLFRCYYHSTCGGHTENVHEVFPDPPLLPLSAVPCQHCKASKHYTWKKVIPRAELTDALARAGQSVRELAGVVVSARTASGRAKEIALDLGGGRRMAMAASEFRLAVGPAKLPSVWFEVRAVPGGYEFTGRGFGHGVGMCQWGAKGMAEASYSATEILRHYYTGAQLVRLYAPKEG